MSVKEPEAKLPTNHCENRGSSVLCRKYPLCLVIECLARRYVVDLKDAVAFADARVKENGDKLKRDIRMQAMRLLMLRAGGRGDVFEAGMLYQCLRQLGMKEFTHREQVNALVEVTCHSLHEREAEAVLVRLLSGKFLAEAKQTP